MPALAPKAAAQLTPLGRSSARSGSRAVVAARGRSSRRLHLAVWVAASQPDGRPPKLDPKEVAMKVQESKVALEQARIAKKFALFLTTWSTSGSVLLLWLSVKMAPYETAAQLLDALGWSGAASDLLPAAKLVTTSNVAATGISLGTAIAVYYFGKAEAEKNAEKNLASWTKVQEEQYQQRPAQPEQPQQEQDQQQPPAQQEPSRLTTAALLLSAPRQAGGAAAGLTSKLVGAYGVLLPPAEREDFLRLLLMGGYYEEAAAYLQAALRLRGIPPPE